MEDTKVTIVDFEGKDLVVKREENELWMTQEECGVLLEYKYPRESIHKIYKKHEREFTNDITRTVVSTTKQSKGKELREFNLEGFAYLCMFSEQPKAELARKWASKLMKEMWVHGAAISSEVAQADSTQIIQVVNDALDRALKDRQFVPIKFDEPKLYRNVDELKALIQDEPSNAKWVYPRIQYLWDKYLAQYVDLKIGVTPFSEDWLRELFVGKEWSKDAVMLHFPTDLPTNADFDRYLKQCGLKRRNALAIPANLAKGMFRDHIQFDTNIDNLVKKYKHYSRDAIQKQLRSIHATIIEILASNEVYGVKRFDENSYADYRGMEQWDNKKKALIFPTGPFDTCWDCLRPISVSTVHLHHMLYDRVGFELWTDFRPLCGPCHAHRHAASEGFSKKQKITTIPNTSIVSETDKALCCVINGMQYWFPKSAIAAETEIRRAGDTGTLVVYEWIAKKKGLI